jgi:hypothetical protein
MGFVGLEKARSSADRDAVALVDAAPGRRRCVLNSKLNPK